VYVFRMFVRITKESLYSFLCVEMDRVHPYKVLLCVLKLFLSLTTKNHIFQMLPTEQNTVFSSVVFLDNSVFRYDVSEYHD